MKKVDLQITKTAIKSIKRLDKPMRDRILAGIKKLPLGDVKKLQGYDYFYRLRIGDYRIIYKLYLMFYQEERLIRDFKEVFVWEKQCCTA